MSERFDPYHQWLGIPSEEQPPNHYRLLGIPIFESDPEVIRAAAEKRSAFLRTFQLSEHSDLSERLLNEVATAKVCLLDPERKRAHDQQLRQSRAMAEVDGVSTAAHTTQSVTPVEAFVPEPTLPEAFDPYSQWLLIPLEEQPPNHYQLLGIPSLESNRRVIRRAARGRSARVRAAATPETRHLANKLQAEIAAASRCLLDKTRKSAYDYTLCSLGRATSDHEDKPDLTDFAWLHETVDDLTAFGQEELRPSTAPRTYPAPRRRRSTVRAATEWLTAGLLLTLAAALAVGIIPWFQQEPQDVLRPTSVDSQSTRGEEITIDLGDGVRLEMVLIPAGESMMGSPEWDPDADAREKPQHAIRITKPFYMGKYEVTQEQWAAVMGDNPSYPKGPKNPVNRVSWDDCQAFLGKLNEQQGGRAGRFCLPTEAEWEYACRAGSSTRWCFGDDEGSLGEYAWYSENSGGHAHPVGQKRPNAWGLYDMHGNVFEWCSDWYDLDYYGESPGDDPTGAALGSHRVVRGGFYIGSAALCRSAYRLSGRPGPNVNILGFRVALALIDQITTRQEPPVLPPATLRLLPIAGQTIPLGESLEIAASVENAEHWEGKLRYSLSPGQESCSAQPPNGRPPSPPRRSVP